MFQTKKNGGPAKKSDQRTTRTLSFENLEARRVMATTCVVLDFTPESHAGNLVDTFANVRVPGTKYSPNFLDFNGDRLVNTTDAVLCAQRVASKVASFYSSAASGYDVRFYWGDVTTQSNWGTQWINYGKAYSNLEVAVMYFGGSNRQSGAIGMAPVASNGYNFEGYGETYTRSIAAWMASYRRSATASEFVDRVAQVAAHELGHMFGLQHSKADMQNNVMNATQPNNAGAAKFLNQSVYTPTGWQNAYQELRNSFRGQYQQWGQPALGGQWSLPSAVAEAANSAAHANLTEVDAEPQNLSTLDQFFAAVAPTDDELQALAWADSTSTATRVDGFANDLNGTSVALPTKAVDSVLAGVVAQAVERETDRVSASIEVATKTIERNLFKKADRIGLAEDEVFQGLGDALIAAKVSALA